METVVVRVWVPDRPGALGVVASAIGVAGADVIGIEILERGGGSAIDEITVALQPAAGGTSEPVDRLIAELTALDGVAVEDVRSLPAERVDHPDFPLDCAALVVEAGPSGALRVLCDTLRNMLDAEWSVAITVDGAEPLAASGEIPDLGWLAAFVTGSRHLENDVEAAPGDLAWSKVGEAAIVVVGRSERPLHGRERSQVNTLSRLTAAVLENGRVVA